jgi:hypothetical protein
MIMTLWLLKWLMILLMMMKLTWLLLIALRG